MLIPSTLLTFTLWNKWIFSQIIYCPFTIKSLNLEGWAVGEAVRYTSNILQTSRWDIIKNKRTSWTSLQFAYN